jgi:hypothetical protein
MKVVILVMASVVLMACAAKDEKAEQSTQDVAQAVRDFIEVRELEEVSRIRTGNRDGWTSIEERFLIYEGRNDTYLVEFYRRCYELRDNTHIVADERWDASAIYARSDTIRGCQIGKIYALTEAEAEELRHLGEAPGSRN